MQDRRHITPARRRDARRETWVVDAGWVVLRSAEVTRRVPVAVAQAALDRLAADGALTADGVLSERVRGVRAHHPVHGRYHVELRGPRWELVWRPRGTAAQRLPLAGVAAHVGARTWARDIAA